MWDQTRGAYKEVGAPNLGSFGEWELFNIREVDAGFVGPLRSLRSRPEPKRQPPVSAGLGGEDMFFWRSGPVEAPGTDPNFAARLLYGG